MSDLRQGETMTRPLFERSLWFATCGEPVPETAPLSGEADAEIAVVGAGLLGLSLALHLSEAGVRVTVLEAEEPGFGASGRSTGFVVPGLPGGVSPDAVLSKLGEEQGTRLCAKLAAAGDLVFELIARHRIQCAGEQSGWLQPAHTPEGMPALARLVEFWQGLGRPVRLLNRAEAVAVTGAPSYHGALLDPTGGTVHPLGYARGLARGALAADATIHTSSKVERLERNPRGWRLVTRRGVLHARQVVLATNALVDGLQPTLARCLLPVVSYQVATQPLDESVRTAVLPQRHCSSDTRRTVLALRWSPCGRLITGGGAALPMGALTRMPPHYLRLVERHFPAVPKLQQAYVWAGMVAVTKDRLPRLYDLGPGLLAAIGCNGRGIAMTTTLGRSVARYLAGGGEDPLPVPIMQPDPFPLHFIARHGVRLWLPWSRLRDRREAERASSGRA